MTYDYKESLDHLHRVGMLNVKGLNEYIVILKGQKIDLELKIIDLESKLQYRR